MGVWLADQVGVNPSTVSKWYTNFFQFVLGSLRKMADLLEVDINELLVGEYKKYFFEKEEKSINLQIKG